MMEIERGRHIPEKGECVDTLVTYWLEGVGWSSVERRRLGKMQGSISTSEGLGTLSGLVPPQNNPRTVCRQFSKQAFWFFILYAWVFCLPVYKCTVYDWCPLRSGHGSPWAWSYRGSYELLYECWELNLDFLQELPLSVLTRAKAPAHKCFIGALELYLHEILGMKS